MIDFRIQDHFKSELERWEIVILMNIGENQDLHIVCYLINDVFGDI